MKYSLAKFKTFVCGIVGAFLVSATLAIAADAPATGSQAVSGTVVETMNAATYTYVQVDTGKEKIWAAAPQFPVKVGDKVSFSGGIPMENYESKTLKRTFKKVYFVGQINGPAGAQPAALPQGHPPLPNQTVAGMHQAIAKSNAPAVVNFSGIAKPKGGLTVGEIYQQKEKLEKKQVTFRGKVVKMNMQIMNHNWVHVQDGTGAAGANNVTVTTDDTAKVGDTVLVKGTVALNKDFGFGYKYPLLVENAEVAVESSK